MPITNYGSAMAYIENSLDLYGLSEDEAEHLAWMAIGYLTLSSAPEDYDRIEVSIVDTRKPGDISYIQNREIHEYNTNLNIYEIDSGMYLFAFSNKIGCNCMLKVELKY